MLYERGISFFVYVWFAGRTTTFAQNLGQPRVPLHLFDKVLARRCIAVEQFGETRVLAEIPWLDPLDAASLAAVEPREGVAIDALL